MTATDAERANARNALIAGFLGWTLDAFDFFVLTFVVADVAKEFHKTVPDIMASVAASLMTRPIGAIVFGLLADRYGRRFPLIANVIFYSVIEVLSGLAPSYTVFFALRLLYGIGMGGEWGVGASLALESVAPKWRGLISGLLQEGYAVGNLLAALVYFLVGPHFSWRVLFFIGGLPALLTLFIRARVKESVAWERSRTDWSTYGRTIVANLPRFLYLVILMAMLNFMSHGTQDLFPTFLKVERHLTAGSVSLVISISMLGAIGGGLFFGRLSDFWGRKRAMVTAALLGACVVPLWVFAREVALISIGAFLIQFMVQGAWGVIPAHLNELSPGALRGFFPGFAYQLGVLIASSVGWIEAVAGQHMRYSTAMGTLAAGILVVGAVVIGVGPEARGIAFDVPPGGEPQRGLVSAPPGK
jgi:SHS family lactate transporter-like MFS transporter